MQKWTAVLFSAQYAIGNISGYPEGAKEQGLPSIQPLPQAISNGLDAVTFRSTAGILTGV